MYALVCLLESLMILDYALSSYLSIVSHIAVISVRQNIPKVHTEDLNTFYKISTEKLPWEVKLREETALFGMLSCGPQLNLLDSRGISLGGRWRVAHRYQS